MATPEEVLRIICPQVMTVSGLSTYIDIAKSMTSSGVFGDKYNYAVALRVAHMYTLNKRNGAGGIITHKQEGRVSQSFGGVDKMTSDLQSTSYGQQLLQLIKTAGVGGTVTSLDIYNLYMGG